MIIILNNILLTIPEEYLPISDVCREIGVTQVTLTRWYNWYEDNFDTLDVDFPKLPPYYRLSIRGTRYFNPADIPMIHAFAANVKRGKHGFMASETHKYNKSRKAKNNVFTV